MENTFEHCTIHTNVPLPKATHLVDYDFEHMFDNVVLTIGELTLPTTSEVITHKSL